MNSRRLMKDIFGKENNINKVDIKNNIIDCKYKESTIFECKTFKNISIRDDHSKQIIIKPLVGFLNKFISEGGVLFLGLSEKDGFPIDIIPIKEELIKDDDQIRKWIIANLTSIPLYSTFPSVEIEKIEIQKKENIFIIEIHPIDLNVVYFSRLEDRAYRRIGDETTQIPFVETLKLIEEKIIPRININLEPETWEEKEDSIEGKLRVVYNNFGNKPGTHLTSILTFRLHEGQDSNVIIKSEKSTDVTSINSNCIKAFQFELLRRPLYPNSPTVFDHITLSFKKDIKIKLLLETHEEKSYSFQEVIISKDRQFIRSEPMYKSYI